MPVMLKFTADDPATGKPRTVQIGVPHGKEKDNDYLDMATDAYFKTHPTEEKSSEDPGFLGTLGNAVKGLATSFVKGFTPSGAAQNQRAALSSDAEGVTPTDVSAPQSTKQVLRTVGKQAEEHKKATGVGLAGDVVGQILPGAHELGEAGAQYGQGHPGAGEANALMGLAPYAAMSPTVRGLAGSATRAVSPTLSRLRSPIALADEAPPLTTSPGGLRGLKPSGGLTKNPSIVESPPTTNVNVSLPIPGAKKVLQGARVVGKVASRLKVQSPIGPEMVDSPYLKGPAKIPAGPKAVDRPLVSASPGSTVPTLPVTRANPTDVFKPQGPPAPEPPVPDYNNPPVAAVPSRPAPLWMVQEHPTSSIEVNKKPNIPDVPGVETPVRPPRNWTNHLRPVETPVRPPLRPIEHPTSSEIEVNKKPNIPDVPGVGVPVRPPLRPVEAPKPVETKPVTKPGETDVPSKKAEKAGPSSPKSTKSETKGSEGPKEAKAEDAKGDSVISQEDMDRYSKLDIRGDRHVARIFHKAFETMGYGTKARREFTNLHYGKSSSKDMTVPEKLHAAEKVLGIIFDDDYIGKNFPSTLGLRAKTRAKTPEE
jgi:hypothetical protein